jgi:hypothetical protein
MTLSIAGLEELAQRSTIEEWRSNSESCRCEHDVAAAMPARMARSREMRDSAALYKGGTHRGVSFRAAL